MEEERRAILTSFLDMTQCADEQTATSFLRTKNWRLEEALNMFFEGTSPFFEPTRASEGTSTAAFVEPTGWDCDEHSFTSSRRDSQLGEDSVWASYETEESPSNGPGNNLASLYRLPRSLMYQGSFYEAKEEASFHNKWLIVNLQSAKEFASSMLNRDTWSNDTVQQTISTNFTFWQVYNDKEEGMKVCAYYKLVSLPAVLIIDPITGQKMHAWKGMLQAEDLLEALLPYMERGPKECIARPRKHSREVETTYTNITDKKNEAEGGNAVDGDGVTEPEYEEHSIDDNNDDGLTESDCNEDGTEVDGEEEEFQDSILSFGSEAYPPLAEEPEGSKEILCRVGIRLPEGRRIQRNFLRTDTVKLLWSFCRSQLEEKEKKMAFVHAIPGVATNKLFYTSNLTFEEAGLCNSVLTLMWL